MIELVYDILKQFVRNTWEQKYLFALILSLFPALSLFLESGLLGYEGAEVYGHAWSYWWRSEQLWPWLDGTDLAYGTTTWPAIDPLPTIFVGVLSSLIGTLWSYNVLVILSTYLAAIGGWQLASRFKGHTQSGALIVAWFPSFLGVQYSGLTEDFSLGIICLSFSLLLSNNRRHILIGAFLLGLVPWFGLVLGWYSALAAIFIFGIAFYRQESSRVFIAASGTVSFLLGLVSALPHLSRLSGEGHRYGTYVPQYEALWSLNPWKAIDMASLVIPYAQSYEGVIMRLHPGYLGITVLVCALFGSKKMFHWWGLALLFVVISLGSTLNILGSPTEIYNPFWLVIEQLPGFSLMNHYGRALLLAAVPLSILASCGVRKYPFLFVILVLDLGFIGPLSPVLPVAPSPKPNSLQGLADLPEGDIVILPASGPGIHPQKDFWDQRIHGRKIWLSPNRLGLAAPVLRYDSIQTLSSNPEDYAPLQSDFPCFISAVLVRKKHDEAYRLSLGAPDISDSFFSIWSRERISPSSNCDI